MGRLLLAALLAFFPAASHACDTHGTAKTPGAAASDRAAASTGVVREVAPDEGSITLGHGRIASLRMAPMTSMVFKVAPGVALDGLGPGTRVRFRAALIDGKPTVTRIDSAR